MFRLFNRRSSKEVAHGKGQVTGQEINDFIGMAYSMGTDYIPLTKQVQMVDPPHVALMTVKTKNGLFGVIVKPDEDGYCPSIPLSWGNGKHKQPFGMMDFDDKDLFNTFIDDKNEVLLLDSGSAQYWVALEQSRPYNFTMDPRKPNNTYIPEYQSMIAGTGPITDLKGMAKAHSVKTGDKKSAIFPAIKFSFGNDGTVIGYTPDGEEVGTVVLSKTPLKKNGSVMIPTDYLERLTGWTDDAKYELEDTYPIITSWDTPNTEVEYMIAPRIENDNLKSRRRNKR